MTALSTARLEGSQFPLQIRSALTEGCSSRSIERLTGVNRDNHVPCRRRRLRQAG
jgi:hypothetical protein